MGVRGAQTPQSLEQKNLCKGGALQYALYFGNHTTKSMSDEIICYYNHSDGPLQGECFFFFSIFKRMGCFHIFDCKMLTETNESPISPLVR